ncbi:hypothetical protein TIFTF001_035410 [Ficus carica]|uniref:Uncharacterized protein n=1 Tax=Ficus carica TaxID=3494 RepID=A0AA88E1I6_FICCA|nr:hypothetical protein TIFTF001_035410 [Ficus carica]
MVEGSAVGSMASVMAFGKSTEGKVKTMTGSIRHSHKSVTFTVSVDLSLPEELLFPLAGGVFPCPR